jgi:hypothetical protein
MLHHLAPPHTLGSPSGIVANPVTPLLLQCGGSPRAGKSDSSAGTEQQCRVATVVATGTEGDWNGPGGRLQHRVKTSSAEAAAHVRHRTCTVERCQDPDTIDQEERRGCLCLAEPDGSR